MSDARSLLKAKRQEERIQHPYASYTSTGQLKCSLCSLVIKYASGWQGHLGSKGHQLNVASEKRKREAEEQEVEMEERRKRAKTEEREDEQDAEPTAPAAATTSSSGFPSDFFSGSNRPVALPDDGDDDDEEEGNEGRGRAQAQTQPATSTLDDEYALFTRTVVNAPDASEHQHEVYQSATVSAEPVMADLTPAGFPVREEEAPAEEAPPAEKKEETEEERRVREHELIMDRILEEERAQEEADERVVLMKAKLEALRLRRLQKKAGH